MGKVRAYEIKKALARRHSDKSKWAIFFEVKNGPTHYAKELLIMDALAIKKSWVNPCFQGYEIKTSRSDFLQDEKWRGYLNYCHKFYFVCPKGMISRKEIENMDENVGLIYYSEDYANCNLHTMKAPVLSNQEIPPAEMLYYIIISKLESDRYPFFSTKKEFFKNWLKEKKDNKKLAMRLEGEIGNILYEQQRKIDKIEAQKKRLDERQEQIEKVLEFLSEKGLSKWNHKNFPLEDNWKEKLDELLSSNFTERDKREIRRAIDSAESAVEKLEKIVPGR